MVNAPKKLIESSIPLKDINKQAGREKSIHQGHPSTLHLWWARRPLAAARAVLFAQLVNDPKSKAKKKALFNLISELVKWENLNNTELLSRARAEIMSSWRETCALNGNDKSKGFDPEHLPAFHDPFAGGGAIPVEAQRLGLESYASDLNPVAVMIEKAMTEIPPRFSGITPVGPVFSDGKKRTKKAQQWPAATGIAEDVKRYGLWMCEEAKQRIGCHYPLVEITSEMARTRSDLKSYVGRKLTVVAWIWARTVPSPDPRFSGVRVPLVSSYVLSKKEGKEVWIEPIIEGDNWRFEIRNGNPPEWAEEGNKTNTRSSVTFKCLLSGTPIPGDDIKALGQQGDIKSKLIAIVCEGDREKIYLPALPEQEQAALATSPTWKPSGSISARRITGGTCVPYGFDEWGKLFTSRQLLALDTFSDLLKEVHEKVEQDARQTLPADDVPFDEGGAGSRAYSDAISTYLAFVIDKCTDYWSASCSWNTHTEAMRSTFGRQAIPMTWDYTECNPFCSSTSNWCSMVEWVFKALKLLPGAGAGFASQADAQTQSISTNKVISTDPPYYDNISYADWSDFFYVWMRHNLRDFYPRVFATMATPKDEELVAVPYRHGGVDAAEKFFLDGMTATMHNLAERAHPAFPVTIYYAFKQSETNDTGTSNAGWETFLEALLRAGFCITGTWPIRTEREARMVGIGTNALASSIVLVCRKRNPDASTIGRGAFLTELREAMPKALDVMKEGTDNISPVSPVDLPQAAIGPGMEVFSKYAAVTKADGSAMSVHEAIIEINKFVGDISGADPATRFCQDWLTEHGWNEGPFGDANTLAQARGTSVDHIAASGVLISKGGKVRLLRPTEYPTDYDPTTDKNRPIWEACHHLIRAFSTGGKRAAAALLAKMPEVENDVRDLCYSLYPLCERKGWADDARAYNQLMAAWPDILFAASTEKPPEHQGPQQTTMDFDS